MPSYSQDIEPISKQFTIMIGLTVVGFMAFGLALSFYRNILFEQTLTELEQQNDDIAMRIDKSYRDLDYYRSDQFRDKYAKENLGKLNPGERLIVITQPPSESPGGILESFPDNERREAAYFELLRQMPVLEHWKLYLFEHDRIEELKNAI